MVQLQTNFGGGKTHSMLALYHLFSGTSPNDLAGVDGVLHEAGAAQLPTARRVVLVGPPTLLMTMRTVGSIWRYEDQGRNAQDIARLAGSLCDKVTTSTVPSWVSDEVSVTVSLTHSTSVSLTLYRNGRAKEERK